MRIRKSKNQTERIDHLRDQWATPWDVIKKISRALDVVYDLDVCAKADTAKAPEYFTFEQDALTREWFGNVWCNPPYSDIAPWITHGINEKENGRLESLTYLVPARTDRKWLAEAIEFGLRVIVLQPRISFLEPPGIGKKRPNSSPKDGSILLFWSRERRKVPPIIDLRG